MSHSSVHLRGPAARTPIALGALTALVTAGAAFAQTAAPGANVLAPVVVTATQKK